ncbi:MAG: SOS response-associated peptidase [Deltaproteobacteria bacterium]|nr:SOS response-associated peptidase [Deltaproteobacteria bacterium]
MANTKIKSMEAIMCGRFAGFTTLEMLLEHFPIDVADAQVKPNYNVAPSQEILAIARYEGKNHLNNFHWGLVPFWAKDLSIGSRLINARSETAATKPSFRNAFKQRRCLIPSNGFYEWKGSKGQKQPMFLTLPDSKPFAFAGLWETWDNKGKEESPYLSCSILTRAASKSVRSIHHRMPVILKPDAFDTWLDPNNRDISSLLEIIQNRIHTELISIPVSREVNSVKNNGPKNIQAIE